MMSPETKSESESAEPTIPRLGIFRFLFGFVIDKAGCTGLIISLVVQGAVLAVIMWWSPEPPRFETHPAIDRYYSECTQNVEIRPAPVEEPTPVADQAPPETTVQERVPRQRSRPSRRQRNEEADESSTEALEAPPRSRDLLRRTGREWQPVVTEPEGIQLAVLDATGQSAGIPMRESRSINRYSRSDSEPSLAPIQRSDASRSLSEVTGRRQTSRQYEPGDLGEEEGDTRVRLRSSRHGQRLQSDESLDRPTRRRVVSERENEEVENPENVSEDCLEEIIRAMNRLFGQCEQGRGTLRARGFVVDCDNMRISRRGASFDCSGGQCRLSQIESALRAAAANSSWRGPYCE